MPDDFSVIKLPRGGKKSGRRRVQTHQRGPDQPALKRQPRRERFGDHRLGGRILHAVRAVFLRVEFLVRLRRERRQADAARGIAARVLKLADLFRDFRLAGARGGIVQRINVVEDAHDDLQPFTLVRRSFSVSSRSAAFSLSFILAWNSLNALTSFAMRSAISRAAAAVFSALPFVASCTSAHWSVATAICDE